MKNYILLITLIALIVSQKGYCSEALPLGAIKEISSRGGWVTLKVVGADGTNYCEACPVDPGGRSTKKCWINEDQSTQISMLLSAQARGKRVYGRVGSFATSCGIYQMSIED